MKPIFRKLKDYICVEEATESKCSSTFSIFGTITSSDCCFGFKEDSGEWTRIFGNDVCNSLSDRMLELYVVGIFPKYKTKEKDGSITITPYLYIVLERKEDIENI